MRAALLALALLGPALAPGAAAAGDPPGPTCGLAVCAEARSTVTVACAEGRAGAEGVLRCTFTFVSFSWGHSPLLLPGRVWLDGDAIAHWSCTEGCAPGDVVNAVIAYATWPGGPDLRGVPFMHTYPGDGGNVTILVQDAELRAPAGSGACLAWDLSLETTALAQTPAVRGVAGPTVEDVFDGDGGFAVGQACLAG